MADDYSDDDTTTGRLTVGGSVAGNFETAGDSDWFKISLQAGVTYGFMLQGKANGLGSIDGLADPHGFDLQLRSASGAWIQAYPVDVTANGNLPAISFTPSVAGDYYVLANSYQGHSTGTYSIAATTGPKDDYNEARPVELKPGSTVTGSISVVGDVDAFGLYMRSGLLYKVVLTPLSGSPQFDQTWPIGMGLTKIPETGDPLVLGGVNRLQLEDFFAVTSHAGPATYTLSVEQVADDYSSTIDDVGLATGKLAIGGSVSGHIDAANDLDWFEVNLTGGQGYRFDTGGADVTLKLRNSGGGAGALYPANDGTFYLNSYSGTYYLEVGGARPGSYTVKATALADDYGNGTSQAASIALGGTRDGRIDGQADVDVFAVPFATGHKVAIVVNDQGQDWTTAAGPARFDIGTAVNGFGTYRGHGSVGFVTVPATFDGATVQVKAESGSGNYTVHALDVTGDNTAPVLLNTQNATLASGDALRLHFSELVGIVAGANGSYTNDTHFKIVDGSGHTVADYASNDTTHLRWQGNDLVVTPQQAWRPGEHYTLSVSGPGFVDLAGITLAPADLRFTVAGAVTQGTAGNDRIVAGKGSATIDAGTGLDTVVYEGTAAGHTIHGGGDGSFTVAAAGGQPDTLVGVERMQFAGDKDVVALDIAGNGGQAYRLYQAAFNRTPDKEGLGFWINAMDHGDKLLGVAKGFIDSPEFKGLYGANTTDSQFVDLLYQNVLHRLPDDAGRKFWIDGMLGGATRADILVNFSESPENQANVIKIIGDGFAFTPYTS